MFKIQTKPSLNINAASSQQAKTNKLGQTIRARRGSQRRCGAGCVEYFTDEGNRLDAYGDACKRQRSLAALAEIEAD